MDLRNIATRAALTFVQAFLAVIIVTGVENINSWESAKPAVVAAVAALISMVYRVVREYAAANGGEE